MLRLSEFPSWDSAIAADEASVSEDITSYDDTTSQGQELLNYLLAATNSTAYYEGTGIFEGEVIDFSKCGEIESGAISWTENKPAGTSVIAEVAISDDGGVTWGDWTQVANGGLLPGLTAGLDISGYRGRYRFKLSTTDASTAPSVSQIKASIVSRKLFRIFQNGQVKAKADIVPNAAEAL